MPRRRRAALKDQAKRLLLCASIMALEEMDTALTEHEMAVCLRTSDGTWRPISRDLLRLVKHWVVSEVGAGKCEDRVVACTYSAATGDRQEGDDDHSA